MMKIIVVANSAVRGAQVPRLLSLNCFSYTRNPEVVAKAKIGTDTIHRPGVSLASGPPPKEKKWNGLKFFERGFIPI